MIFLFVLISILISFAIGANDETFSTIYTTKRINMIEVLVLASIYVVLGAFFLGRAVSETVGKNILYVKIGTTIVITLLI
jgi:phosphate/sulfate permease